MHFPAYYGVITASILGYLVSFVVCLFILGLKYKINYEKVLKDFVEIMCASLLMIVVLFLLKFIIPISVSNRFLNIFIILVYMIVGMMVYFYYTYKTKTIKSIFGNRLFKKKK